jgi:hypothetical protein
MQMLTTGGGGATGAAACIHTTCCEVTQQVFVVFDNMHLKRVAAACCVGVWVLGTRSAETRQEPTQLHFLFWFLLLLFCFSSQTPSPKNLPIAVVLRCRCNNYLRRVHNSKKQQNPCVVLYGLGLRGPA